MFHILCLNEKFPVVISSIEQVRDQLLIKRAGYVIEIQEGKEGRILSVEGLAELDHVLTLALVLLGQYEPVQLRLRYQPDIHHVSLVFYLLLKLLLLF